MFHREKNGWRNKSEDLPSVGLEKPTFIEQKHLSILYVCQWVCVREGKASRKE